MYCTCREVHLNSCQLVFQNLPSTNFEPAQLPFTDRALFRQPFIEPSMVFPSRASISALARGRPLLAGQGDAVAVGEVGVVLMGGHEIELPASAHKLILFVCVIIFLLGIGFLVFLVCVVLLFLPAKTRFTSLPHGFLRNRSIYGAQLRREKAGV